MDCAQSRSYIGCYVDGELDPVISARLEGHLQQCPQCTRAAERLEQLRSVVKQALPYRKAPDGLARRVRARAHAHSAEPQAIASTWWKWLQPVALVAGTALVTWLATTQLSDSPQHQVLAQEIMSSHARASVTGHISDVESSERHTVKPWLSGKLDYSPPVEDLTEAGFPLVGGRLDYVAQRPVSVLVYHRRKHVIDLFIWPDTSDSVRNAQVLSKNGYQVVHWTNNGMTFWAVSDLNAGELKQFAEKFAAPK